MTKLFKNRKKFLAIDFDVTMTKIAYMQLVSDHFRLLAHDVLRSSDDDQVISFIKDFCKKNPVREKDVILSISDPGAISTKSIAIPPLPDEEVFGAVKWQLKEDIPFDPDNAVADWQVIREYSEDDGTKKNGLIFILAKNETIKKYLSIASQCSLKPARIVNGSFNYANILKNLPGESPVSAVIDICFENATINIYEDKKLSFVRALPFSVKNLVYSLTETLVSEQGKLGLSLKEAEEIINTVGIPEDETVVVRDNIKATHLISLMRPLLEILIREIKFSLHYFSSKFNATKPFCIYIVGVGANLKGFEAYLKRELGFDIKFLPIPDCITNHELRESNLTQQEQNEIIRVLAAGIGDDENINLLPLEVKTQDIQLARRMFVKFATVIMVVTFVFSLFVVNLRIRDYKNRVKTAKAHLSALKEIESLRDKIRRKEKLMVEIQADKIPAEAILKFLSNIVPDEITMKELRFVQRDKIQLMGDIAGGEGVGKSVLTNFMNEIEKMHPRVEASLVSFETNSGAARFKIECDLRDKKRK